MSSLKTIFERKFTETFPDPAQRREARLLLPPFEDHPEAARYRIWLAILKLSSGDIVKFPKSVASALEDPEDTIEWAERPFSWEEALKNHNTNRESAAYDLRDWEQYVSWLA
jgi:hypothetical protein